MLRWLEWVGLFVLVPVVIWLGWVQVPVIPLLLVIAVLTGLWLVRRTGWRLLWRGPSPAQERAALRGILSRFLISAALLLLLLAVIAPERLFDLPLEHPRVWLALVLLYPLLSVYPQELVYRVFFFNRYGPLFRGSLPLTAASALTFGWMHLVFSNAWAVLLTLCGGWYFAETYLRTRSMRLVWFEHSLYGVFLFTVGFGDFFIYDGVPV